jgi:hypothetical protein
MRTQHQRGLLLPASLRRILPALACTLTLLALPSEGLAGGNVGDDTNASSIIATDDSTWAGATSAGGMQQVMGGASTTLPGASTILGPAGIYAIVLLSTPLMHAQNLANMACPRRLILCLEKQGALVDQYLTTYFGYLLDNPAVSGLLLLAEWQQLQPTDPGPLPVVGTDSFYFNYVGDALAAINAWNSANCSYKTTPPTCKPSGSPKTLQLDVSPGFNSPTWLFTEIDNVAGGSGKGSCDGLFMGTGVTVPTPALTGCGYTNIFYRTESDPHIQLPLPMPWSPIYKNYWQAFLSNLNQYVTMNPAHPEYAPLFVSIGVGGPTASSTEMILPNGNGEGTTKNPNPNFSPPGTPFGSIGQLTLHVPGSPTKPVPGAASVYWYQAWNCLLGNNYAVAGNCISDPSYGAASGSSLGSSYINSNRAFIEEWAAAIDMYGEIFSGVTLIVTRGNGLPELCGPLVPPLMNNNSGCPADSMNPFLVPPGALAQNCSTSSTPTMDCAAENAIVAYFAGPPIGGPNAKATAMAGLKAGDLTLMTGAGSASRPVKWLTYNTTDCPSVLNSSSLGGTGSMVLVSRMLGGLQLAAALSKDPEIEGCEPNFSSLPTFKTCTAEDALLSVLAAFFSGTSVGGAFPNGTSTIPVGSQTIVDAPLNYLQIWDDDILYSMGWGVPAQCTWKQLMTPPNPKTPEGPPPGCVVETSMPIVTVPTPLLGSKLTAKKLLEIASELILTQTAEPITYPVTYCPNTTNPPYVARGAFQGDPVCVTNNTKIMTIVDDQFDQVAKDNLAAYMGTSYSSNYTDYSYYTSLVPTPNPSIPNSIVPYGVCAPYLFVPQVFRQAYMGDYVCVSQAEAAQVASDNAAFLTRRLVCFACPSVVPRPPLPGPH